MALVANKNSQHEIYIRPNTFSYTFLFDVGNVWSADPNGGSFRVNLERDSPEVYSNQ